MKFFKLALLAVVTLITQYGFAQAVDASTGFPSLDQWKAAVIAGDAAALKAFYSTNPAAEIETNRVTSGADTDVSFWLALKARSIKMEIVRLKQKPERTSVIFKADVQTGLPNGQTVSVTDAQGWQKQGDQYGDDGDDD